jgi:hypothetical protein
VRFRIDRRAYDAETAFADAGQSRLTASSAGAAAARTSFRNEEK